MIENYEVYQKTQKSSPWEPLILKEIPKLPSENREFDVFTCPYVDYLLISDSYSGFINFQLAKYLTCKSTIKILKDWFGVYGIPRILKIDNASNY